MNITALSSASDTLPSQPITPMTGFVSPSVYGPSWALGAGLCDKSNTNPCGGVGISWNTMSAFETYKATKAPY